MVCFLHFDTVLFSLPLEACYLALPLPLETPHSSVMLSSFRKRRVQVFDQHAGSGLPFWFCLACREDTFVAEVE